MKLRDLARKPLAPGEARPSHLPQTPLSPVRKFLLKLSAIFLPLVPALIACGLITSTLNIVKYNYPLLEGTNLFQLFTVIGNTAFWGINIFVGFNSAREFGGTPILGGILGALITHPNLATITLNGYPLTPGRGGVVAVLLVAALGACVEKKLHKVIPNSLNLLLTPLLTYLIAASFAIFFLQPFAGLIAFTVADLAVKVIHEGSPVSGFLLSGTFLPMVMMGIHQTLLPIHSELISRYGLTLLLPILAMAGAGQVGASLAVFVKTRNQRLKKAILSALPVGLLGIGEPLIYGVTLPLGRPFLAACLGGAFGGAWQSYEMVGSAASGISGLPLALATNKTGIFIIGLLISYVAGFIAAWLIGFEDLPEQTEKNI